MLDYCKGSKDALGLHSCRAHKFLLPKRWTVIDLRLIQCRVAQKEDVPQTRSAGAELTQSNQQGSGNGKTARYRGRRPNKRKGPYQEHGETFSTQDAAIQCLVEAGLSEDASRQLFGRVLDDVAYSDLLDLPTLQYRAAALSNLKAFSQRVDLDMVVQHCPWLVTRDGSAHVQRMVNLLGHLIQGENQYMNVDWVAVFNQSPRLFNVSPQLFGERLRFVDKLYFDTFGVKDFASHILIEKSHQVEYLRVFIVQQQSLQKSLDIVVHILGLDAARALFVDRPATLWLGTDNADQFVQRLQFYCSTLGSEQTVRLLTLKPSLLRGGLHQQRRSMAAYINYLYKGQGYTKEFVQGVLSNAPAALTMQYQTHIQRFKRVQELAEKVPEWKEQIKKWSPEQAAKVLTCTQVAIDRLRDVPDKFPDMAPTINIIDVLQDSQLAFKQRIGRRTSQRKVRNTMDDLLRSLQRTHVGEELARYPAVLTKRFESYLRYFTAEQLYQMVVVRDAKIILYMPERVLLQKYHGYRKLFSRFGSAENARHQYDVAARILSREPRLFARDPDEVGRHIVDLNRLLSEMYGSSSYVMRAVLANPALLFISVDEVVSRVAHLAAQVRGIPAWKNQLETFTPARFATLITLDSAALDRPGAVEKFSADIHTLMLQCPLHSVLDMTEEGFAQRFPQAHAYLQQEHKRLAQDTIEGGSDCGSEAIGDSDQIGSQEVAEASTAAADNYIVPHAA